MCIRDSYRHDLAGNACVDGRGHKAARRAHHLAHQHFVADLYAGRTGSADVLGHGQHDGRGGVFLQRRILCERLALVQLVQRMHATLER